MNIKVTVRNIKETFKPTQESIGALVQTLSAIYPSMDKLPVIIVESSQKLVLDHSFGVFVIPNPVEVIVEYDNDATGTRPALPDTDDSAKRLSDAITFFLSSDIGAWNWRLAGRTIIRTGNKVATFPINI